MVLQVICTFIKLEGFWYQNSFLDFFRILYIAAWDYLVLSPLHLLEATDLNYIDSASSLGTNDWLKTLERC